MSKLAGKRVAIVGGSQGVGRRMALAARNAGAQVLAVARRPEPLTQLAREAPGIETLSIDATAEDAVQRIFATMLPDVLVLCGGARPAMGPVQTQTWEQFSSVWNNDVHMSLNVVKAALATPLAKGSTVVLVSSGAGLGGSQMSGGYAGAKRMQMFMAEYAQDQSDRLGLGIRFIAVVPLRIMASTEMGAAAIAAYSTYYGITPAEFAGRMDGAQTPEQVASAFVELVAESPVREGNVFTVSASGIAAVP